MAEDGPKLSPSFCRRMRPLNGVCFTDRELWSRRTGDAEVYFQEVERHLKREQAKKRKRWW